MNDSMLMLAAARQGDLTREAEQDKMAARARAVARPANGRADGPVARSARLLGLTAARMRPTAQGR
jgi:hypothetical protein